VLDVRKPLDLNFQVHAGLEYAVSGMFYLRAGYKYGHDVDGVTAGAGVEYNLLRFDYAIGLMGELGMHHHLSVLFHF
ncbi:hypothetical protein JW933_01640, partial [candidate division FCPU426 bacterium]|nr:hypothetical protein [candidate division FCPU426 bacterium]